MSDFGRIIWPNLETLLRGCGLESTDQLQGYLNACLVADARSAACLGLESRPDCLEITLSNISVSALVLAHFPMSLSELGHAWEAALICTISISKAANGNIASIKDSETLTEALASMDETELVTALRKRNLHRLRGRHPEVALGHEDPWEWFEFTRENAPSDVALGLCQELQDRYTAAQVCLDYPFHPQVLLATITGLEHMLGAAPKGELYVMIDGSTPFLFDEGLEWVTMVRQARPDLTTANWSRQLKHWMRQRVDTMCTEIGEEALQALKIDRVSLASSMATEVSELVKALDEENLEWERDQQPGACEWENEGSSVAAVSSDLDIKRALDARFTRPTSEARGANRFSESSSGGIQRENVSLPASKESLDHLLSRARDGEGEEGGSRAVSGGWQFGNLYHGAAVVVSLALLVALGQMPGGYYELLRWVVSVGAVIVAYTGSRQTRAVMESRRTWLQGGLPICVLAAILFNPVIPFYASRDFWRAPDCALGLAFAAFALIDFQKQSEEGRWSFTIPEGVGVAVAFCVLSLVILSSTGVPWPTLGR